ncbi:hypothetical protein [Sicyoidochytrium minutum DNA virus]|nr:hypothetical protein [Sicyoidochytrium minutum DNA virus]
MVEVLGIKETNTYGQDR